MQRILASGDVEVDEGDYDKRTALHLAASEGHIELMGYALCSLSLRVYASANRITSMAAAFPAPPY